MRVIRSTAVSKTLKSEILKIPGVKSVAGSNTTPPVINELIEGTTVIGRQQEAPIPLIQLWVGDSFFDTYQIRPIAGRLFEKDRSGDSLPVKNNGSYAVLTEVNTNSPASAVLSMRAVKELGFESAEAALNQTLKISGDWIVGAHRKESTGIYFNVIGVVPDTKFQGVQQPALAKLYWLNDLASTVKLSIRYESNHADQVLESIETAWDSLFPDKEFQAEFIDQLFANKHKNDQDNAYTYLAYALIAIVLSCLGMYGLASFNTHRRTKEVGIRKILGANRSSILKLLLWDLTKPVVIASVIATAVSLYFMNNWLSQFPEHIALSPTYFLSAAIAAVVLVWVTVAAQTAKTMKTNPAETLRYE